MGHNEKDGRSKKHGAQRRNTETTMRKTCNENRRRQSRVMTSII